METKIFFVEDDLPFGGVLKNFLELNAYNVDWHTDGQMAIEAFKKGEYQLAIIDVMLPNVDGLSVANYIKSQDSTLPFVFLTAKSMKEDVLNGYKAGADDYVVKPFDTEVLLYKLNAILNRVNPSENSQHKSFSIGQFTFNTEFRQLSSVDGNYTLSPREAEILGYLVQNKNKLVTKTELLTKYWGENDYFNGRSLDVFIAKLRRYLIADETVEIKSIVRSGYVLKTL